jgi:hypothetical protein
VDNIINRAVEHTRLLIDYIISAHLQYRYLSINLISTPKHQAIMCENNSAISNAGQTSIGGQPQEPLLSCRSVVHSVGINPDFDPLGLFEEERIDVLRLRKIAKEVEDQSTAARSAEREWFAREEQEAAAAAAKSPNQPLSNQDKMSAFTPSNAPSLSQDGGVTENADATDNQQ